MFLLGDSSSHVSFVVTSARLDIIQFRVFAAGFGICCVRCFLFCTDANWAVYVPRERCCVFFFFFYDYVVLCNLDDIPVTYVSLVTSVVFTVCLSFYSVSFSREEEHILYSLAG